MINVKGFAQGFDKVWEIFIWARSVSTATRRPQHKKAIRASLDWVAAAVASRQMPVRDEYAAGTPSWIELSTPDLDGAKQFYGEIFGWDFDGGNPEYGYYTQAFLKGHRVAGIRPIQENSNFSTMWNTYLATDDADAIAKKAVEEGGTILMEPMDVGDVGRMLLVRDPIGALVGFLQTGSDGGTRLVNEPGTPIWNELVVSDTTAVQAFYGALFDYKMEPSKLDSKYLLLKIRVTGNEVAACSVALPADTAPYWMTYFFAVGSVDNVVATVVELGGTVIVQPFDGLYGRFVVCKDRWGATFALHQNLS